MRPWRFRWQRRTPGQQILHMHRRFPGFEHRRENGEHVWRGKLQPSEVADVYELEVRWRLWQRPQVLVITPPLHPDAPHRYGDGSLCLDYPPDCDWSSRQLIATHTIPWAAESLYWYEIWLETGIWYGPEKHHTDAKTKE